MSLLSKVFILSALMLMTAGSAKADLVIDYTDGSPSIGWPLPMAQGTADAMAMRFTNPNAVECTLKTISAALIDDADILTDTVGDLFFVIYAINTDGQFDTLIYFKTVPNAEFAAGFNQPLNIVNMDVSALNITFQPGEEWGVAVTTDPNSAAKGEVLTFASDSGTKPSQRWYEVPLGGNWQRANCCHGGIDVNMHIYSTISSPPVNNPPILDRLSAININETDTVSVTITASDGDGDFIDIAMTSHNLPPKAVFDPLPNVSGTATLFWPTSYDDSGTYFAEFTATDGKGGSDVDTVSITVNNVNRAPEIEVLSDRFVNENEQLTFFVSATDADLDSFFFYYQSNLPGTESFIDLGNGGASFEWTPTYDESGVYTFVYFAEDIFGASDTDTVLINVNNINLPPVLDSIGSHSVNENDTLRFFVTATDFDNDAITMSLVDSDLPDNYNFYQVSTKTSTQTYEFILTPSYLDSGTFTATFVATDGVADDSEIVSIQIFDVNRPPLVVTFYDTTINEGQNLHYVMYGADSDGDPLSFFLEDDNLPSPFTFTDSGNDSAIFDWTPTFDDAGSYDMLIYLDDGRGGVLDIEITITVNNVNRPPELTPIGDTTINEGETLNLLVEAIDLDNDSIYFDITYEKEPPGAVWMDNFDGTLSFSFTPSFDDGPNSYEMRVLVYDTLGGVDFEDVIITVNNQNRAPYITPINDTTINENQPLVLTVIGNDDDGDNLTFESDNGDQIFTDNLVNNGDNTATYSWTPSSNDAGIYRILFTVLDGNSFGQDTVFITVNDVNELPLLTTDGDQTVNETEDIFFSFYGEDPDGGSVTVFPDSSQLPPGAVLSYEGNSYAWIDWSTTYDDAGIYPIRIFATDGVDTVFEDVTFTVNNVNRPPVLAQISDTAVDENAKLTFNVTASDDDDDIIELSIANTNLPEGYTFESNARTSNAYYLFDWTPTFDDAGNYFALIEAFDGVDTDTQTVIIDVRNVDRPAILNPIGAINLNENDTVQVLISAFDPDAEDTAFFGGTGFPSFADLESNGDETANLLFFTDNDDAGTYQLTIYAYGQSFQVPDDSEIVTVTVNNVNQPPVLDPIGPLSFTEGVFGDVIVSASDPDGDELFYTTSMNLPPGSYFDLIQGEFHFGWTPDFTQAGQYSVTFYVADEFAEIDSEVVQITVNNSNRPPVLDSIGGQVVNEGETLQLLVTATDADNDSIYFDVTYESMPPGAVWTDNFDGTLTFTFTPTYDLAPNDYFITVFVYDTLSGADFEDIIISVINTNQPPSVEPLDDTMYVAEGNLISIDVFASDPDGDCFSLRLESPDLPVEADYFSNECGDFGSLFWQTDFDDAGTYTAYFIADDGEFADTELVTIIVLEQACSDVRVAAFSLDGPQQISRDRLFQSRLNLTLENLGPANLDSQFTLNFYSSHGEDGSYFQGSQTVASLGLGQFDIEITDSVVMRPDANLGPAFLIVEIENSNYTDCDRSNNRDSIPFELVDNIPSVLDSIGNQVVNEGETLGILLTASDADGDILEFNYFWNEEIYPNDFSFTDSGNGVAYFELTPNFDDQGVYRMEFTVQDYLGGKSGGGSFDYEDITITVNDVNRAPEIDPLQDTMFVNENNLLQFSISASDPDFDCLSLSMYSSDLPQDAQFFETGECGTSGSFSWQTDFADAGTYSAFFVATDGGLADTDLVTIIVNDVPCADLRVSAFSIDGPQQISGEREFQQRINLTLENLGPVGVDSQFTLNFYSSHGQQGTYFAGSHIVNSLGVGQLEIDITSPVALNPDASYGAADLLVVIEEDGFTDCDLQNNLAIIPFEYVFNIPPVLDSIGSKSVNEGETLSFIVSATDWDFEQVYLDFYFYEYELDNYPNFYDSGNGRGYFEWTPSFNDAGEYYFEFYVYDNNKSGDYEEVQISVIDFNRNPLIDTLPDTIYVDEREPVAFRVSATDPDDDCFELYFESPDLPQRATFDYVFDCVDYGDFSWLPAFDEAGTYHAFFIADDQNGGADTDLVVIVVNNINAPPRLVDVPFQSVDENSFLTFDVLATDIDGNLSSIFTGNLPDGATFVYNGGGSGTFEWTPDCNQGIIEGSYYIPIYAADDSGLVDTGEVYIEVRENCDQPLTVVTTPCVLCSPPQFYTDILPSEGSFEIEFNNIIEESSLSENITITSARGDYLDYNYNAKSRKLQIYSYYGYFAPVDTIRVSLTTGIFDLSESSLDSAYNLTYTVGPVVYPGDCNNNGVVDEVDVLFIGLYWNEQGPDRDVGEGDPIEFYAQPAHFQQQGRGQWDPNMGVYADVNGDGIVDANDLCGITINFGQTVYEDRSVSKAEIDVAAVAKGVDSKIFEQMREALIECPDSRAKEMLLAAIENAINNASGPVLPKEIVLNQNYPNPFNPSTTIEFYLPKAEQAKLEVFNMLGQRVVTLVDEKVEAGYKTVIWSGTDYTGQSVASGIYFYRLTTESKEIIKRMLLVK